jgi:polar amino acid transport system ATP-binding protein
MPYRMASRPLVAVTAAVAREVADRVCFLDGGRILEQGPPAEMLDAPSHPHTRQFCAG